MTEQTKTFDIPAIHPAGYPFVAIAAGVTLVLALLLGETAFWICAIITFWVAYFFRNPERVTPVGDHLIISPADGKVCKIEPAVPPEELGMGPEPLTRISIFLNLMNVHINRVPASGIVIATHYRPGKFVNAALDKASIDNERMSVRQRLTDGREIAYVQIAGLVARRIICTLAPDKVVKAGERFGLIRFGSRADVYLPKGVEPMVLVGQDMIGGETILANLTGEQTPRIGEVR